MEEAIARCDAYHKCEDWSEAVNAIFEFKDDPNPEVQWRLARAIFKEGEHKSGNGRIVAVTQAVRLLAKNLDNHPECWNSHLWIAIILSDKDEECSLSSRVDEALLIKQHIDKCLELNPQCGMAYHLLGVWCFDLASISGRKKMAIGLKFPKMPDASYQEAINAFNKAEELCPDISNDNSLLAAKCLLKLQRTQEAKLYLQKCIYDERTDSETLFNITEARRLATQYELKI